MIRKWMTGLAVLAALSTCMDGQQPVPFVCPLSDAQSQKAIDAFAKLAPIFKEPRCANCHGGVSPFKPRVRNHPAGDYDVFGVVGTFDEDFEKTFGPCQDCHSAFQCIATIPCWRLAPPEMRFTNKDTVGLCKLMKREFPQGADAFLMHMLNDQFGVPFLDVAFAGTMGLNETGLAVKENTTQIPDPPKSMTRFEMFQFAKDWVDAMGGKFQGDERCGCEPTHFAVRVHYESSIVLPIQTFTTVADPADIPISFHDNGTFDGEGGLPQYGAGANRACVVQGKYSVIIKASGNATEDATSHHMHVDLSNATPEGSQTSATCQTPWGIRTYSSSQENREKQIYSFDVAGKVGDSAAQPAYLPAPGGKATIGIQIIDLSPDKGAGTTSK
jgi:hypothetical protein